MQHRVTGIGGVFFKAKDPEKLREWYARHLGFNCDQYGTTFVSDEGKTQFTVWSPMSSDTKYFNPSKSAMMFNFTVENLEELLRLLSEEGVEIVGEVEEYDYGKFGWVIDPEGNKIELWEPVKKEFGKMTKDKQTG